MMTAKRVLVEFFSLYEMQQLQYFLDDFSCLSDTIPVETNDKCSNIPKAHHNLFKFKKKVN